MTIDTLPLSQHALISEEECAEIASRVRDLTDRWTVSGAILV